ncbi:hypothetical protein M8C21_001138 [Ambrosia artemisiifolia]|uniref:RING-type domain-containing protein n=1 Tax=Ambrosia artemisiifolia TaxID=4212 RepID=A0AAD5GSU8_AMBAR|nr:hypothetical protein M8C21_001138 [Ambrosia artemisiifolia]
MSTQGQVMRYARNGKRRKAELDLNVTPVENLEQGGGPTISVSQAGQGDVPSVTVAHGEGQARQPAGFTQPAPIDVEELDDDVIISSPRAFEEAKKKSRRTRRAVVVDVEAEEAAGRHGLNQAYKRRRSPPIAPVINCELYVNLDGSSNSTRGKTHYVAPPPPPPPPKEPTFSCPVCMGPLVEEVTTKCGHIFCKACITAAIKAQHKCPTSRLKTMCYGHLQDCGIFVGITVPSRNTGFPIPPGDGTTRGFLNWTVNKWL